MDSFPDSSKLFRAQPVQAHPDYQRVGAVSSWAVSFVRILFELPESLLLLVALLELAQFMDPTAIVGTERRPP